MSSLEALIYIGDKRSVGDVFALSSADVKVPFFNPLDFDEHSSKLSVGTYLTTYKDVNGNDVIILIDSSDLVDIMSEINNRVLFVVLIPGNRNADAYTVGDALQLVGSFSSRINARVIVIVNMIHSYSYESPAIYAPFVRVVGDQNITGYSEGALEAFEQVRSTHVQCEIYGYDERCYASFSEFLAEQIVF